MITQAVLKQRINYNDVTGEFTWITQSAFLQRLVGKECGSINNQGYRVISLNGKRYGAHRLAFLYMDGSLPTNEVDHINHDESDNRFINLRCVKSLQNKRNKKQSPNNSSGVNGVHRNKRDGRYYAQIKVNNKTKFLGSFVNKSDAIEARRLANIRYNFHINHGNR